jgi:hypothetical protein
MAKIKFKTDKKGNFAERSTFELVEKDFVGVRGNEAKAFVKLLSPKDASLTVLTLTINKTTYNIEVPAGKVVLTPKAYPIQVGKNQISFDGNSDTPEMAHEIEVNPQLLK